MTKIATAGDYTKNRKYKFTGATGNYDASKLVKESLFIPGGTGIYSFSCSSNTVEVIDLFNDQYALFDGTPSRNISYYSYNIMYCNEGLYENLNGTLKVNDASTGGTSELNIGDTAYVYIWQENNQRWVHCYSFVIEDLFGQTKNILL